MPGEPEVPGGGYKLCLYRGQSGGGQCWQVSLQARHEAQSVVRRLTLHLSSQHHQPCHAMQSGALSLVGIVEIELSLVESFMELKYFHNVATPALLCHKEPARTQLVLYGIRDSWLPLTGKVLL